MKMPLCQAQTGLGVEGLDDTSRGRRLYRVEADRQANDWIEEENRSKSRKMIRQRVGGLSKGWIAGGEKFRNWLLDSIEEKVARSDRRYRSSAQ